ncbi:MAG: hypothetical protein WCD42_02350 [Rhizomicrobium sp.]
MSGATVERGPNVYAISRDFWDDPEFSDAAYSDREAWLWLIGAAAWKDLRTRGSTGPVNLKRGELSFSVRFLAEKWGWSKSAVDRFFAKLEKRDTLRDTSRDGNKVYFIRNYNRFQVVGAPKRDSKRDSVWDAAGTDAGQMRDKEETGITGVTGVISDRPNMSLPLSDPQGGPDVVGALPGSGQEETTASAPSPQPVSAAQPAGGAATGHAPDGFERFWKQSEPPKHASKLKARQAWVKTRHVRPADDVLIACHAAYRASVAAENARRKQERPPRAAQSLCHPETFLAEQRWEGFVEAATATPVVADSGPDWGADGAQLSELIGPAVFAGWFAGAMLARGEGGAVTITVAKAFNARWIEEKFRGALVRVFGDGVRVEARSKSPVA